MKKLKEIIISLLFVCLAVAAPFSGVSFAGKKYGSAVEPTPAATVLTPAEVMLQTTSISQADYRFSLDDFEQITNEQGNTEYYLYVNTTITIKNLASEELSVARRKTDESIPVTEKLAQNKYHVIAYDGTTKSHLVRLENTFASFSFYLIQTETSFISNTDFYWEDSGGKQVTAPTSTEPLLNYIRLNNIYGSQACPIYIDFYFNGEFYSLYNIDGVFYNTITNNRVETSTGLLTFSVPGEYQVFIYDKTCYKALRKITFWEGEEKETTINSFDRTKTEYSPFGNIKTCSFVLKQHGTITNQNMYLVAKDSNGDTIVSRQTVNSAVNIQFYNLDPTKISSIKLEKSHVKLTGGSVNSETYLYPDKYSIAQLNDTVLTESDDSTYTITMYDRSGNIIGEQFKFTILTDIHSSYKDYSALDRNIVPDPNVIVRQDVTEFHETNYTGFVEITDETEGTTSPLISSTTTQYFILLARNSTSVDGIQNNTSVNNPVSLTVYGVGDIKVNVIKDGTTVATYTMKNRDTVNVSDVGSYTVQIEDQMGTIASKSFKINRSLTAPTIALIVIGSVALVLLVFWIIRMRTRLNVR